jgi:hypothetical protein
MDGAAIGSSSMKLDSKRVPYTARPLRQAWRLHIRVTPVRCPADFLEPRIRGACMIAGGNGISTGIGITKRCAVTGELFADEARNLARVLEGAFGTSCVIRPLVSCGI